jgi:hypothetical protein
VRDGFGGQLLDALLRRFDAVQAGIGELTVLRVGGRIMGSDPILEGLAPLMLPVA